MLGPFWEIAQLSGVHVPSLVRALCVDFSGPVPFLCILDLRV